MLTPQIIRQAYERSLQPTEPVPVHPSDLWWAEKLLKHGLLDDAELQNFSEWYESNRAAAPQQKGTE